MKPLKRISSVKFWPSLASLALFAGLCAIVAYWGLQLTAPAPAVAPADLRSEVRPAGDSRSLGGLFGTPNQASALPMSAAPGNIQVVGITAGDPRASAILSVDGAPGRFFALGATVTDGVRLLEIRPGSVIIERGGARSELPAPLKADLSVLTSGVGKTRQTSAGGTAPAFGAAAAPAAQNSPGQPPTAVPAAPTGQPGSPIAPGTFNPSGASGASSSVMPRGNPYIPNSGAAQPAGAATPGADSAQAGSPPPGVIPPGAKTF